MLRSVVKAGIKSSILALDKIKYGLGCLKEEIEDIAAEARSELSAKAQPVVSQKKTTDQRTTQKTRNHPLEVSTTQNTNSSQEATV